MQDEVNYYNEMFDEINVTPAEFNFFLIINEACSVFLDRLFAAMCLYAIRYFVLKTNRRDKGVKVMI